MSSQKANALKVWFPVKSVFRDGAFGKRLDHEDSDFMNGFIHWWVHNLMVLLGGNENARRWGLVGDASLKVSCP